MPKANFITLLFFLHLKYIVLAGGLESGAATKDTAQVYSSISLIQAVQNKAAVFTQDQLVLLIDTLMELDTVSHDYYTYITNCLNKYETDTDKDGTEEFPGSNYYSTWDNRNFYNTDDLLQCDTVINIVLLDSSHNNYVHPCPGIITSSFGWRDNAKHNGIDIDLNKGDKVVAAFDGVVRIATKHGGYGNVVVVRHYNGLETLYAHLSKIKVASGEHVNAGAVVGLGGSTGKSTGSHLHFEVRFKGLAVNPANIISFKEKKLICDNDISVRKNKWGIYAYPKDSKFHTVQKGDILFDIAKKYGVTTRYLRELNGISKNACLKVGYKLRVS